MPQHAIALVPGFLGFGRRRDHTYFADRFIAGIRASVEALAPELEVAILALPTEPIDSLADRQARLLDDLKQLDRPALLWHLIGHSSGGVDAELLTRTTPLREDGGVSHFVKHEGWCDYDDLVGRIASVTTIAAPHHGTNLAEAAAALMGGDGLPSWDELRGAGRLAADLLQRDALAARLRFFIASAGGASSSLELLGRLFLKNELARELRPAHMHELQRANNSRGVPTFTIATVAPAPPDEGDPVDRLYADLHRLTSSAASPPPPPWPGADGVTIIPKRATLPPLDEAANDGVVTTLRQSLRGRVDAIVFGDHGDVMGRYRRTDPLDEARGKDAIVDPGLLTSGASFDDETFFSFCAFVASKLVGLVARADAAPPPGRRG